LRFGKPADLERPPKLLFDENLAARLVRDLADLYPDSSHVIELGLGGAADQDVWARAGAEDFVLVTKDEDFHRLSVLYGPPPKVVWLRLGNGPTVEIARLLRFRAEQIAAFAAQSEVAFLALG
jgi:predicted nuclease of predicted toxin-antitoxin system